MSTDQPTRTTRTAAQGRPPWETPAWIAVLAVAAAARLWQLGVRVMTHDESLHAYHSLQLLLTGTYTHDPTYHGPLLYYVNCIVYWFFGASDFTARLAPAIAGVALIGALWLFRCYLGRTGALLAASFVAVSPTLLFYSRHIRNDIYVALFAVLWIYGAFRYLESRKPRWLYLVTGAMALAFATKEVSFILGAVIGSFFVVVAFRPGSGGKVRRDAAGDLVVLMLTLVVPFAAGFGYTVLGWDIKDPHSSVGSAARGAMLVGGLVALAVAIVTIWSRGSRRDSSVARLRLREWAKMMALFWGLLIALFTTFLTNIVGGLVSGIVGSLGYWLGQHEVARGSQPWFYYAIIGTLYEPLLICAGGLTILWILTRLFRKDWDPVVADELPGEPLRPSGDEERDRRSMRRTFAAFAGWWAVASWIAYALAGEKMPWLLTHMTLPLCFLAGLGLARLLRLQWRGITAATAGVLAGGTAVLLSLAVTITATRPFAGRDIQSVAQTAGWLFQLLVMFALVVSIGRALRLAGLRKGLRVCAIGAAALLGIVTLRTSLQVNFVNYDLATEPMSYAQGSPDILRAMREIERISTRTVGGHGLKVAFDDQTSWPFVWYLRDYPNAHTWGDNPEHAKSAPVILVGARNREDVWEYVAAGYVKREYVRIWWPMQDYSGSTLVELVASLADPQFRERLRQIVFDRRYPGINLREWPLREDFDMFVRSDFARRAGEIDGGGTPDLAQPGASGRVEKLAHAPNQVIRGPFEGTVLENPTDVAVAPDGAWIVADAGNHRLLVLDSHGFLRLVVGDGPCAMTTPGRTGCTDPDGDGPLAVGDGQFNEPWGVAVGDSGEIYVADSWNGRVQVFDRQGAFRRKWGRFGMTSGSTEGLLLYGPRGLGFDDSGNLVVADTGNKRLLVFTPDGSLIRELGHEGHESDAFDEPVGLARDANHTLLVADAWNQRIKRLDVSYRVLAIWDVSAWHSRAAADKPYLATDAAGTVYASDPAGGRILIFSAAGRLTARLDLPSDDDETVRPTGVAVDPTTERLLVVDHAGGRLLVYPLYRPVP
jgi:uncharacterized protein (TIGR03663 family)